MYLFEHSNPRIAEKALEKLLIQMMREDVGRADVTTSLVPNRKVVAEIISNGGGVVSGIHEAKKLFNLFNIRAKQLLSDGETLKKHQPILLLSGMSHDVLRVERTALNILSRMSGISTRTRKYVDIAKSANPNVELAATRKTTPLFRYFEKKAVVTGGAFSHRMGLYDMVLIKDNHLKILGGVANAMKKARRRKGRYKVEIEANSIKDAVIAAREGADVVMLDNLLPNQIKRILSILGKEGLRKKVLIEVSGGVDEKNLKAFAKTGADIISLGRLTYDAPIIDFSLEIQ